MFCFKIPVALCCEINWNRRNDGALIDQLEFVARQQRKNKKKQNKTIYGGLGFKDLIRFNLAVLVKRLCGDYQVEQKSVYLWITHATIFILFLFLNK